MDQLKSSSPVHLDKSHQNLFRTQISEDLRQEKEVYNSASGSNTNRKHETSCLGQNSPPVDHRLWLMTLS